MIRHAENAKELAWNWAGAIMWSGKSIRVSDAQAEFADYKRSGGWEPFAMWVKDCNYKLVEEPPEEET